MLVEKLWTGETFRARRVADPERVLPDQNLIQFMPLLLGDRRPRDIAQKLVARLVDGGFITEWGLATESPQSSFYEDDGYWRGPHLGADDAAALGWPAATRRNGTCEKDRGKVLFSCF